MKLKEYLYQRYTEGTAKVYEREIEIYLSNNPKAKKALYKDLVEYLGALRKRYPNGKSVKRILASLKAYYDFLNYTGKR